MKRFVLLLTLAATTMAADCPGGDETNGPDGEDNTSLVGAWTLQSINNDPLPASWVDGDHTHTVTAGSITVAANLSFIFNETDDSDDGADNTTGTCALTTPPRTYTCTPAADPNEPDQTNATAVVNGSSMTLTINDASSTVRLYSRN
jgi:hypothetical protein